MTARRPGSPRERRPLAAHQARAALIGGWAVCSVWRIEPVPGVFTWSARHHRARKRRRATISLHRARACIPGDIAVATEKEVLAALAAVPGLDGRTPLPQSGALAGVSIQNGKVYLSIAADPAKPGAAEPMRKAAEDAVRKLPGVTGVLATLTAERPAGSSGSSLSGPRVAGSARGCRDVEGRRSRRQAHHRRRVGQGRRRQVHDRGQYCARPRRAGPEGRRARRRHLRPVDAEALRPA